MNQPIVIFTALLLHLQTYSLIQVAPNWQTSNYMQAASNSIINGTSTTGSGTTPTATLPFPTAFSAVPNLAYGMSYYESSDNLGSEMFEVNKTSLTTTSFSVLVQISGNTDIWIIVVRYIAVSKSFPHHLNSFDNVPVNYGNGALTAFNTRSLSTLVHYSNTINYTLQANSIGSAYNTFTAPYSNIKILLFMTSMFFDGEEPSSSVWAPIDIRVSAAAISVDQYRIDVSFGYNALCSRLHYSMIIFDQADVQASGQYILVCQRIDFPTAGGDVAVPFELIGNAIMGWTDFSTYRTETSIVFYLIFQNLTSGSYGVHMPVSVNRNSAKIPITRFGFTLFYLKTWICPNLTYYNQTLNLCSECLIANCSKCLNETSCQVCANGFVQNSTTSTCDPVPCTIPNCLACVNSTFCQTCNSTGSYYVTANGSCALCDSPNYFVNLTSLNCELCSLAQCLTCSSLTQCAVCNTTSGYFENSTDQLCHPCSIPGCSVCLNLTACQTCSNTTILNSTDALCYPCPIFGCSICLNLTACQTCASGYAINTTDSLCEVCGLEGCINCTDVSTCAECNTTDNYILTMNETCEQCQVSLNYFPSTSFNSCELCALPHCLVCVSLVQCSICDLNNSYYLETNGSCQFCDRLLNRFISQSTLYCESCQLTGCINCSSLTQCLECNSSAQYFLNLSINLCEPCGLANCLICQSLTQCLACDEGNQFFLNSTTRLCQPCAIEGCLNCSSLESCFECDLNGSYGHDFTSFNLSLCGLCNVSCVCDGHGLPWVPTTMECTPICGDGLIRLTEGCDDNNTDPGDGCSSFCSIELSYTCEGQPSNCSFFSAVIPVSLETIVIQRQGCNGFMVKVPKDLLVASETSSVGVANPGVYLTSISEDSKYTLVHFIYSRDLVGQAIVLILRGSAFRVEYQPLIPALYYSQSECKAQEDIKRLLLGVQYIGYSVLLASLLSCKIVGLELFGVLQLSYFSLAEHSFLNVYLAPLLEFNSFNGLNVGLVPQTSRVPKTQQEMKIASSFLNNCNIMLIVCIFELIVAGVLCLISKAIQSSKIYNMSLNLLKQGFITLVLFSSFNISFSAGVHINYANKQDQYYGLSTAVMVLALLAMLLATVLMEFTSSRTYGEFKTKFKNNWVCRLFIPTSLLYRMSLGFYTALKSEYGESTLIILSVVILFMLYLLTNLPYNDAYQNYRSGLIHVTMVVILVTANYYRSMKSTTPLEVKARIYTPAIIELVMITLCVGISVLAVGYETFLFIRECMRDKSISKVNHEKTEESDIDIDIDVRKGSTEEEIN